MVAAAILLPLGARAAASRWNDDTVWANSLHSLGGLEVPFDFAVYLRAAEDVRAGESPYVDPDQLTKESSAPYVYPPLLAILLVPVTVLPDDVHGSSPAAVLASLFAIGCLVGALLALDVRDWRCYPIALLYPPTVENVEYGAVGPILVLLVALGWRYRERNAVASLSVGSAIVLKVFLWPLVVWLAVTRRWKASLGALVQRPGRLSGSPPPSVGHRGRELVFDLRDPRGARASRRRGPGSRRDLRCGAARARLASGRWRRG